MKDSLQEGKQYCDQCDGEGLVKEKPFYPGGEKLLNLCRKCKGSGQLDWVEMVVGKKIISKSNKSSGIEPVFQSSYYRKIRGV